MYIYIPCFINTVNFYSFRLKACIKYKRHKLLLEYKYIHNTLFFFDSVLFFFFICFKMDPAEEQAQEIEILQSIYPDELEFLNDSQTQFQIQLNLDVPSERRHGLILVVKYPASYPEVIPDLRVEIVEQEDDEDDGQNSDEDDDEDDEERKATKLALHMAETIEFEREDLSKLLSKLNEEAELMLGMPSIFTLATVLKEEAENLFESKLDAAEKEFEKRRNEREKVEQQKFQGTKVTPENWLEWRNKFRAEMQVDKKDELRKQEMHNGRMTGKEIFEKGLAKEDEGDTETNGDDQDKLAEGVSKVTV
ncbi:hypothetical protein LELG_05083 [Lodderomyces elongisporus NRRL YB-4239]|uniref:RWD domain-containing protein n=1 Tax=Lodderomyces elongisporus (strain ATCC 11503 / CBS 2605 / JCM 1781 / NBRC 1676 / NRRL YB-4239) TaxID=379508 RepID=A5E644_LODEL|nr:hypothetical protein LELG_05083 [Lodderomyces elongisporus NRRL YB-4239]